MFLQELQNTYGGKRLYLIEASAVVTNTKPKRIDVVGNLGYNKNKLTLRRLIGGVAKLLIFQSR